jgi:hypothetical protein
MRDQVDVLIRRAPRYGSLPDNLPAHPALALAG